MADDAEFQAMRGHRLDPPRDPRGVSCGAEDGPAIGPIRLLVKTAAGFEPRPVEELNGLLENVFGREIDCAGLLPGLRSVARALNDGDIARAMITTTQMRLPYLSEEEAQRAAAAVQMQKAADGDPVHPGWPAGTPGGRGGRFRPKNETGEAVGRARRKKAEEEIERHLTRTLIRAALRKLLTPERVVRLAGEAAGNLVPVVDVVADAALVAEIAEMTAEYVELKRVADAALDFVQKGPYELKDLLVDKQDRSFSSFQALKKVDLVKYYGPAGDGFEYHHIVEQGQEGALSAAELNSTRNVIRIPKLLHEEISGEYARRNPETGLSPREALQGRSFEYQYDEGIKTLLELGIIK